MSRGKLLDHIDDAITTSENNLGQMRSYRDGYQAAAHYIRMLVLEEIKEDKPVVLIADIDAI